jgi:iron complex transport system permease protein
VSGGFATAVAVYLPAWKQGVHGYRLILVGIGASAVLGSATSFLYVRADIGKAAQAASWLIGSLNARGWATFGPSGSAWPSSSRSSSHTGGGSPCWNSATTRPPPSAYRPSAAGSSCCAGTGLTAMAVAAAGPIPFVAMAAPQLARRVTRATGPNVPPAAWTGALLVSAADLATQRVTGSALMPVGVVTGVGGGLYLAWLLRRERLAARL